MPSEPHFGYWVKNADAARARLEAAGLPTCFARVSEGGETLVSYHRSPWGGFFVELVSEKARPALQALLDGGTTGGRDRLTGGESLTQRRGAGIGSSDSRAPPNGAGRRETCNAGGRS